MLYTEVTPAFQNAVVSDVAAFKACIHSLTCLSVGIDQLLPCDKFLLLIKTTTKSKKCQKRKRKQNKKVN